MALQIILEQIQNIEEAIQFCRETGDQSLWTILINYSKDKPSRMIQLKIFGIAFVVLVEFIDGLLNHAGSDINLQQLIESIRSDLQIPNLRDSLCKIMRDYNIQVCIHKCWIRNIPLDFRCLYLNVVERSSFMIV